MDVCVKNRCGHCGRVVGTVEDGSTQSGEDRRFAASHRPTSCKSINKHLLVFRRYHSGASDSAYSDTFLRSVVCLSYVCHRNM